MIRILFITGLFFIPSYLSAAGLEAVPRVVQTADEVTLFDRWKRPNPAPEQPNRPEAPAEPPKFEFPDAPGEETPEVEDETEDRPEPTEEQKRLLREAGIEDWTKEDWQKLIELIMYLVSLFAGGGLGARVKRV